MFYTSIVVTKPGKAHKLVIETFIGPISGVDIRNVHYAPLDADLDTLGHKNDCTHQPSSFLSPFSSAHTHSQTLALCTRS